MSEQKVIVAGAGGVLGRALVNNLLVQGARVVATDIDIALLKKRLIEVGVDPDHPNLTINYLNLTCAESVKSYFAKENGLTGAVNAAYPRNGKYGADFFDVELDSFNENLSSHLGSSFIFAQQAAAYFVRTKKPFSLVNIASIYGVVAPRFSIYEGASFTMPVEYAAIKAGLLHLSRYIAAYVKDSNFRSNCVSPGGIADRQPQQFLDAYQRETNGRGMLDVQDVMGAIIFLLSDESRYITGQNIIVDDGFSL